MTLNKIAGVFALIIMLLTGLVIGQLSSLTPIQSSPKLGPSTDASATAFTYYKALNHLLATGDPTAFRASLHPRFVDHSNEDDSVRTGEEFEAYLTELVRTSPGLHIEASVAVDQGGIVGSQLTYGGTEESVADGIVIEFDASAFDFELLRVEDDRIVERWADTAILAPGTVEIPASIEVDIPDQHLELYLNRITLERFTRLDFANESGAIVMIESGNTDLVIDPASNGVDVNQALSSSTLVAGDVKFVHAGAPFWIANTGTEPVTVLAATLSEIDYSRFQVVGSPTAEGVQPGVSHELLAYGPGVRPETGAFEISLRLIDLAPGSAVADHMVQESEIALVIEGSVEAIVSEGKVRQMTPQGTVAIHEGQVELAAGEAVAVPNGVALGYQASGDVPVQLMLITISPVGET